jgi:class 3 adenylate cyclase
VLVDRWCEAGSHAGSTTANLSHVTEDSAGEVTAGGKVGWWARHTSVATRLAIGILVVSVLSLVGSVLIAVVGSGSDGEDLLHGRLASVAGARADQIDAYLGQVEGAIRAFSEGRTAIDGVQAFVAAYDDLDQLSLDDLTVERRDLAVFYLDEFLPRLEDVRGLPVDVLTVSPAPTPATVYLQAAYIAQNPLAIDEKRLLTDADDGSMWTEVHKELHPILRDASDRLGFSDLYLIEPDTLTVVYSTNKGIELGTSLESGPHSGTALGRLVDRTVLSGEPGTVLGTDLSVYAPEFDEPTAFVAAPLFDGDRLVGVAAASLSNDAIDDIMSIDSESGGLGETGEIYLAGSDGRMRSNSRAFVEDPEGYLVHVDELGLATAEEQNQMRALGTTALFQLADTTAVRAALQGETGFISDTSYLGDEVYTAYQPLDAEAFDWVILAEQERAEVDAPVGDYVRGNLFLTAVVVVALTFFAAAWASSFVNPLRAISAALQRIKDGSDDTKVPSSGASEFRVLSGHLNAMVDNLASRKDAVADALAKKTSVLVALLPAGVADAVVAGDRRLVETIPQASVVVLVVNGLDELFRTRDTEANRDLMHSIVDIADEVAAVNGLERVKVMGDTYHAVCGVDTPYLDHAPRTVRFAAAVLTEVRRFAEENGLDLDVSGGINTGPATVGLTGSARLIYDVWGEAAEGAADLAGRAAPGEILVTDDVRDRLPDGRSLLAADSVGVSAWVAVASDPHGGPRT